MSHHPRQGGGRGVVVVSVIFSNHQLEQVLLLVSPVITHDVTIITWKLNCIWNDRYGNDSALMEPCFSGEDRQQQINRGVRVFRRIMRERMGEVCSSGRCWIK